MGVRRHDIAARQRAQGGTPAIGDGKTGARRGSHQRAYPRAPGTRRRRPAAAGSGWSAWRPQRPPPPRGSGARWGGALRRRGARWRPAALAARPSGARRRRRTGPCGQAGGAAAGRLVSTRVQAVLIGASCMHSQLLYLHPSLNNPTKAHSLEAPPHVLHKFPDLDVCRRAQRQVPLLGPAPRLLHLGLRGARGVDVEHPAGRLLQGTGHKPGRAGGRAGSNGRLGCPMRKLAALVPCPCLHSCHS